MDSNIVYNYFYNKLSIVQIVAGVILIILGALIKPAVFLIFIGFILVVAAFAIYSSKNVSDEDYLKVVESYIEKTKEIALTSLGITESKVDDNYLFTYELNKDIDAFSYFDNGKKYSSSGISWSYLFFDDSKVYCYNVLHNMLRSYSDMSDKEVKNIINIKDITNVECKSAEGSVIERYMNIKRQHISIQPSSGSGFEFDTIDTSLYLKLKEIIDSKKSKI